VVVVVVAMVVVVVVNVNRLHGLLNSLVRILLHHRPFCDDPSSLSERPYCRLLCESA
jgi:hypothetical protein